jgi:sugar lactone lactonase YvrE
MVEVLKPEAVCSAGASHGEGPLWHTADRRLDWTDIPAGHLHRFDPVTGRDEVIEVGSPLGCFAARDRGGYVVAIEPGFAFLDPATGACEVVAPIDPGPGPAVRMNDGKYDPQGRFWAGTMATNLAVGRGSLFRLDADLRVTKALDGLTVPNGLDWSEDGHTLYFIDSLDRPAGVDALDFDGRRGSVSGRRRLVDIGSDPPSPTVVAVPDGMTVDAAGSLWVAVSGAGEVVRYSAAGQLTGVVEMPVAYPTSVAFGGEELCDLYITTATLEAVVGPDLPSRGALPTQRRDEGALFRCRPAVPGRSPRTFAG